MSRGKIFSLLMIASLSLGVASYPVYATNTTGASSDVTETSTTETDTTITNNTTDTSVENTNSNVSSNSKVISPTESHQYGFDMDLNGTDETFWLSVDDGKLIVKSDNKELLSESIKPNSYGYSCEFMHVGDLVLMSVSYKIDSKSYGKLYSYSKNENKFIRYNLIRQVKKPTPSETTEQTTEQTTTNESTNTQTTDSTTTTKPKDNSQIYKSRAPKKRKKENGNRTTEISNSTTNNMSSSSTTETTTSN